MTLAIWGRQHGFSYTQKNSSYATKPNARCYLQILDWITPEVLCQRALLWLMPWSQTQQLMCGNGQLRKEVTLVNYGTWAIRIAKTNINSEVLFTYQLCELQMYVFIKHLPSSETIEVSNAHSHY